MAIPPTQVIEGSIEHPKTISGNTTFSEAVDFYCKDYCWQKGFSVSTVNNFLWMKASFIRANDDITLSEISPAHVTRWRRYMDRRQWNVNSANAYLYKFRRIVTHYARCFDNLRAEEIIIPKKHIPLPKFITRNEIARIIAVAQPREQAIISLLYSSGIRVGELTRTKRTDIIGNLILVRGKGNKDRTSFIDETCAFFLKQYLESRSDSCPFLFPSRKGGGVQSGMVEKLIRDLGVRAGITSRVTPHVLRHSFATHLAQSGIGPYHLKELMGHADISTTQTYVHLGGKDIADAYAKHHLTVVVNK